MAVISLPLSFTNSFWSQDYRKGLEVLFTKLQQGVVENDEIIAFIRARASAESALAAALSRHVAIESEKTGFGADDGATLLLAFRGLQAETLKQAEAHKSIAIELSTLVADPFAEWAKGHRARLDTTQNTLVERYLRAYEATAAEVWKLKNQYLDNVRKADEAEDDAKFAPNSDLNADKYTTSPRTHPAALPGSDTQSAPRRSGTVSERIASRLREIQKRAVSATQATPIVEASGSAPDGTTAAVGEPPKVDKGKGRAVEEPQGPPEGAAANVAPAPKLDVRTSMSPEPPFPPPLMLLAGLSLPPSAVSDLLRRARSELSLRPIRFPILGEYQDCFSGEEFVVWLRDNVDGFGGSLDRAEDAARDLTERDNLLRRIGEFRNFFEINDEAFYQFRPRAFELGKPVQRNSLDSVVSATRLTPVADNLLKRSNTFLNVVSKALAQDQQPRHVRARAEADDADREYRIAVRKLDRQRLGLEERIEESLRMLQKLETERLRAVKTVLLQYHGTLTNLPKALDSSMERSNSSISAFIPETDLVALIERYRTGPFRPAPQLYESVAHDEADVVFGIDLRRWADGGWGVPAGADDKKELIPPVFSALLAGLMKAYAKLPDDDERRKCWIYEVPLRAVHHARESLNACELDQPIPENVLDKYDAPVLANTIKLWLLELDPPLALWDGWDDIRQIYPSVGSGKTEKLGDEEHREALRSALHRFPKVHLYVLDALIKHVRFLIQNTVSNEADEVYITKLALSIGRLILRPKHETSVTLQDRHPAMFFIDLINMYDDLIPPTIAKKKTETERKMPIRKRTALVDMRMSRNRLSVGSDARNWLASQRASEKLPPLPPTADVTTPTQATVNAAATATAAATTTTTTTAAAAAPNPATAEPVVSSPTEETPTGSEDESEDETESDSDEEGSYEEAEGASDDQQSAEPTPPSAPAPAAPKSEYANIPPPPAFKSPPPEDENLPPRPPAFKEPDLSDVTPIPRPSFADPPSESDDTDPSAFASPVSSVSRKGSVSRAESPKLSVSTTAAPAAAAIPPQQQSASALKSGDAASRMRGPRVAARGPRPASTAGPESLRSPGGPRPGGRQFPGASDTKR